MICAVIVVWWWIWLRWHGGGVEADRATALKWYRRAAERGYEPARIAVDAPAAAPAPLRVRAAHRSTRIVKPLLYPKNDVKYQYICAFYIYIVPKTSSVTLTFTTDFGKMPLLFY